MVFFYTQRHYLQLTMLAAPQGAKKLRESILGNYHQRLVLLLSFLIVFPISY